MHHCLPLFSFSLLFPATLVAFARQWAALEASAPQEQKIRRRFVPALEIVTDQCPSIFNI